jgi:PAS domain S-box-containing protein
LSVSASEPRLLHDVQTHLRLASLVAECAARLSTVTLPVDFDQQIEVELADLLRVLRADRCVLIGGSSSEHQSWVLSASTTADHDWISAANFATAFPWHFARLCANSRETLVLRLGDAPADAVQDRQSARNLGLRSMVTIGVHDEQGHPHGLVIQSASDLDWSPEHLALLEPLARILVNAWERRHVEEARQVESQHVDVLESVGVVLWRADVHTFQTTFVSREVEAILGYPLEMWVKVPGFWLDHIHPDDREWVQAYTSRAVAERRAHDFEYRMIVNNGRTVWLRNIVKVIVEHDEPVALVGASVDVTERKRAEFEIEHLRHQLMHAGRVTTLGELTATLAHELNQPLGALVSNAETALMTAASRRTPRQLRSILHDILRDAQRAGQIVHRVRMLLQRRDLEAQSFDADRVVSAVVALVEPLAVSRHIEVRVALERGLHLHGDIVQIQQLLLNLILNAIDAVSDQPDGGRQIVIRGRDCGADVEIAVSDTGRGVAADALPRIFEPFFTTRPGGLGMGLAICRTIVEAHGGQIAFANNPSSGATVKFTLRSSPVRETAQ